MSWIAFDILESQSHHKVRTVSTSDRSPENFITNLNANKYLYRFYFDN